MRTNNTFTVLSEIHISGLEISITEKTSGLWQFYNIFLLLEGFVHQLKRRIETG
jgi:hypothetical protein